MYLNINVPDEEKARKLASFLRSIPYIKSVDMEDPTLELTEEDWVKPGRPATDTELEKLAAKMESEEGDREAKEFFHDLKKKLTG